MPDFMPVSMQDQLHSRQSELRTQEMTVRNGIANTAFQADGLDQEDRTAGCGLLFLFRQ